MRSGIFNFPGSAPGLMNYLYCHGSFEYIDFTAAGSFSFKLSYTALLLLAGCGGGGGGGGSNGATWGGSGGGASSLALPLFQLILPAGEELEITIGAGGAGGTTATNGTNGGHTTIDLRGNQMLSIERGLAGLATINGATGGAGGGATNGIVMAGTNGASAGSSAGRAVIHEFDNIIIPAILARGAPGAGVGANSTQYGGGGSAGFNSAGGGGKNGFLSIWFRPISPESF